MVKERASVAATLMGAVTVMTVTLVMEKIPLLLLPGESLRCCSWWNCCF